MNLTDTNRKLAINLSSTIILALWVVIAVTFLTVFTVDLRLSYGLIASPCDGQDCHYQALTMKEAEALTDLSLPVEAYALYMLGITVLTVAVFVGLAIVMLKRLYPQARGVFFSLLLIVIPITAITNFDVVAATFPSLIVPIQLLLAFGQALAVLFCLVFPNGRLEPRWTFIFPIIIPVMAIFGTFNETLLKSLSFVLIYSALLISGATIIIYRYRRLFNRTERQQTKWVLLGMFIFLLGVPIWGYTFVFSNPTFGQARLWTLMGGWTLAMFTSLVLPVTIFIAILRNQLWDIDIIINRTLVYGGITVLVTVFYILFVVGSGSLVANQSGLLFGLILTTVVVLLGIRPIYDNWQAVVNRFVPRVPNPQTPTTNNMIIENGKGQSPIWRAAVWLSILLGISLTLALMGVMVFSGGFSISQWVFVFVSVLFITVGSFIIIRRPENRIGRLCLAIGWLNIPIQSITLIETANLANDMLPFLTRLDLSLSQIMATLLFIYLPLLFPTGNYLTPRWRRFGRWFAILMVLPIFLASIKPGLIFDWTTDPSNIYRFVNPFGVNWPWLASIPDDLLFAAWSFPTMVATFISVGSLILRWRRSKGDTRQQIKWVVFYFSTVVSFFILYELVGQVLYQVLESTILFDTTVYDLLAAITFIGFPLVIGLTVFKYRLYDIDIIINRTLVYGGLSLGIVAIYILVVGGLGALFQSQGSILFALLATGLIAVLFQPLRERLQQRVNRLMFGDRDDPYAILSKLSAQLQTTATPESTLQSVVENVAETLKLPYVAIELADEQGPLGGAATGSPLGDKLDLPLRYQNESVGRLVVSPRSPGEAFNEREQKLLADIAAQTGPMAHAVRLTAALQRSREKLVLTREEERRRIRRDLHDELGPTLASQTFAFDAILDLLETNPQEAARLLRGLKSQNQETVADIRRLVHELRPPALDELGLLGALQAHVAKLNGRTTLPIKITATPNPLPPLSAAVEVAAYRIALEAITNVVRHAQAQKCDVQLKIIENGRPHLQITITDNGLGLPANPTNGLGLRSMRERAEELGGWCEIVARGNKGTQVTALLPLI